MVKVPMLSDQNRPHTGGSLAWRLPRWRQWWGVPALPPESAHRSSPPAYVLVTPFTIQIMRALLASAAFHASYLFHLHIFHDHPRQLCPHQRVRCFCRCRFHGYRRGTLELGTGVLVENLDDFVVSLLG